MSTLDRAKRVDSYGGLHYRWMVYIMENPIDMDENWGCPYFRKHPNHPTPSIVYRPNSTQHHDPFFRNKNHPAEYIKKSNPVVMFPYVSHQNRCSPVENNHLVGGFEHEWIMTFLSVGNVMIPTDELIFFRGVGIPPTSHSQVYEFIQIHSRYTPSVVGVGTIYSHVFYTREYITII